MGPCIISCIVLYCVISGECHFCIVPMKIQDEIANTQEPSDSAF